MRLTARITGGQNLQRLMKQARWQGEHEISAGFYTGQKYPSMGRRRARPLAQVAAWQEFGTPTIPERPFMRPVVAWLRTPGVTQLVLSQAVDPKTSQFKTGGAVRVATMIQNKIKEEIRRKSYPPNAPATVRKKGFDDPLIETKRLWEGVKYRVWLNAPRSRPIKGGLTGR